MRDQDKSRNKKNLYDIGPKSNPLPWIPEGNYEAVCTKAEVSKYLGTEKKLYLHFRIIAGGYAETEIFGVYNFKYKSFPRGSKYYTDWAIANGALPSRKDRMSTKVFMDKVMLVKVRDVMPKYDDGTPKPEMFRYSIVDRIIERLTV